MEVRGKEIKGREERDGWEGWKIDGGVGGYRWR